MPLTPGTRLGPCEILAAIGAVGWVKSLKVTLNWAEEIKAKMRQR